MLLVCVHSPVVASQASSVQTSWSSQSVVVPTQAPSTQASPVVQRSPSSQLAVLFTWTHASVAVSHESSVQGLPSSQAAASTTFVHVPSAGSQVSSVQATPSSQLLGVPAQAPSTHVSPVVHRSPSSQLAVLFAWVQAPSTGSQESSVQGLPSSQAPHASAQVAPQKPSGQAQVKPPLPSAVHVPPLAQGLGSQTSPAVQVNPSPMNPALQVQVKEPGVFVHVALGSQVWGGVQVPTGQGAPLVALSAAPSKALGPLNIHWAKSKVPVGTPGFR